MLVYEVLLLLLFSFGMYLYFFSLNFLFNVTMPYYEYISITHMSTFYTKTLWMDEKMDTKNKR